VHRHKLGRRDLRRLAVGPGRAGGHGAHKSKQQAQALGKLGARLRQMGVELVGRDRDAIRRCECYGRGRARQPVDQRKFAEHGPGTDLRDFDFRLEPLARASLADRHAPAFDDEGKVARIALREDPHAGCETEALQPRPCGDSGFAQLPVHAFEGEGLFALEPDIGVFGHGGRSLP